MRELLSAAASDPLGRRLPARLMPAILTPLRRSAQGPARPIFATFVRRPVGGSVCWAGWLNAFRPKDPFEDELAGGWCWYRCALCVDGGVLVAVDYEDATCPRCGAALDWSEARRRVGADYVS